MGHAMANSPGSSSSHANTTQGRERSTSSGHPLGSARRDSLAAVIPAICHDDHNYLSAPKFGEGT